MTPESGPFGISLVRGPAGPGLGPSSGLSSTGPDSYQLYFSSCRRHWQQPNTVTLATLLMLQVSDFWTRRPGHLPSLPHLRLVSESMYEGWPGFRVLASTVTVTDRLRWPLMIALPRSRSARTSARPKVTVWPY